MIKVKISNSEPCVNFTRQTPNGHAIWGNCVFYFNEDIPDCDYWVIYDSIKNIEKSQCIPENTIFITGEPPSIKNYSKFFLNQFHTVFTCRTDLKHKNIIKTQPALPWLVGIDFNFITRQWDNANAKTWNYFSEANSIVKTKLISIITSNKTFSKGHKNRINFLNLLSQEFSGDIDVYGAGFRNIKDKSEGLTRYKYSIVIENSSYPDYWTEKLADCFLSETFPIYYGCPNIYDYFPNGSLAIIDIDNGEEALNIIKSVIKAKKYEKSIDLIRESKDLILSQYQFFPLISDFINRNEKYSSELKSKKTIRIYPEKWIEVKLKSFAKIVIKKIRAYVD